MIAITLSPDEVARRLVSWLALARDELPSGAEGVRALLLRLRHIQLDPLDVVGTNADLVAFARVHGLQRGDVHHHLRGHAFEHFAKMRCLLPASYLPQYRDHEARTAWWKTTRDERLPAGSVEAVLAEVRARGPIAGSGLTDQGSVEPLDWNGWVGTKKASSMALEVLWGRAEVVVVDRTASGQRIYDVPERVFPEQMQAPSGSWGPWALMERAHAAGLLPLNDGPQWTTLHAQRKDGTVDRRVEEGALVRVKLPGSPRVWVAPRALVEEDPALPDDRMRVLGPLDPLLWDRKLVQLAFGFDYVWEVYKPAEKRRWGWYVCPLLHRGRLVGRIEARVRDGVLVVDHLWWEEGAERDEAALGEALHRLAECCGAAGPLSLSTRAAGQSDPPAR